MADKVEVMTETEQEQEEVVEDKAGQPTGSTAAVSKDEAAMNHALGGMFCVSDFPTLGILTGHVSTM